MATKYIAKNTPIQVYSNLIGFRVLPGEEEEGVNCNLFYSVDGEYWSFVDTIITEENNIIGNIPRYLYLAFSQDVVITVE